MTYDEFQTEIAPLYRQFAPKMPEAWKAEDLGDKYRVCGRFSAPVLRAAVLDLLETAEYMPKPSAIRAACARRMAAQEVKPEYAPWDDPMHCPCGCGGERWSYLVRDLKTHEIRYFPTDPAAMGMPPGLDALPAGDRADVAAKMLALCGKAMTRDEVECLRFGQTDRGTLLKTDSRGVKVYDRPIRVPK